MESFELGNLDSMRDWGHAKDYVEGEKRGKDCNKCNNMTDDEHVEKFHQEIVTLKSHQEKLSFKINNLEMSLKHLKYESSNLKGKCEKLFEDSLTATGGNFVLFLRWEAPRDAICSINYVLTGVSRASWNGNGIEYVTDTIEPMSNLGRAASNSLSIRLSGCQPTCLDLPSPASCQ